MRTTKCKTCGTRCLSDTEITSCNNCDPAISKLIADVADNPIQIQECDEEFIRKETL